MIVAGLVLAALALAIDALLEFVPNVIEGRRRDAEARETARRIADRDAFDAQCKWWADFVHNPGVKQKGYAKLNASLTYYSDDARWNIGVWGKNLTDEAVIAATAAAGIPGPATAYMDAPRTYGIRAGYNF